MDTDSLIRWAIIIAIVLFGGYEVSFKRKKKIVVGGLYAVRNPDGTYQIEKILKADKDIIHICLYRNVFQEKPTTIDPSTLFFTMTDEDVEAFNNGGKVTHFGAAHLPISRKGYWNSDKTFIVKAEVTEDDLIGYSYWENQMKEHAIKQEEK